MLSLYRVIESVCTVFSMAALTLVSRSTSQHARKAHWRASLHPMRLFMYVPGMGLPECWGVLSLQLANV